MKKFLFILLMLVPMLAGAQAVDIDGIYYNFVSETKTAEVTNEAGGWEANSESYSGAVTIPSTVTYDGVTYSVTRIGEFAFGGCSDLISVTIPNSVISIGAGAFYGCSGLTLVTIPNSVTYIGDSAFSGCESLVSVNIPNSVTYIGGYAFYGCESLVSVDLPNSITRIESCTFEGCTSLTSVTIPSSVTSIGGEGDDGNGAFAFCESLSSVNITDLTAWCEIDFEDCSNEGFYGTTANPLFYAHHLFLNGEEIEDLVIPNTITTIRANAFLGGSGFTSITIPNTVTTIEREAFACCAGITSLTIPNSVTYLGDFVLDGCRNLKSVTIGSSLSNTGWDPFGAEVSNIEEIIYAEGCTRLIDLNQMNLYKLKSITIPTTVTSVEDAALCSENMIDINISDVAAWCGVKFDDDGLPYEEHRLLFNGEEIKDLVIPNAVTAIKAWTFSNCPGLTTIAIPSSVSKIERCTFGYSENIKEVTCLASQVPDTDENAFAGLKLEDCTLKVPTASVEAYSAVAPWKDFGKIEGVETETAIKTVDICNENGVTEYFMLDGKKVSTPLVRGSYIMKNDKKSRIIIVK